MGALGLPPLSAALLQNGDFPSTDSSSLRARFLDSTMTCIDTTETRHAVLIPWFFFPISFPGSPRLRRWLRGLLLGLVQPACRSRRTGRDRWPSPDSRAGRRTCHRASLPPGSKPKLSAGLPADPGQAEAIMQQRLREGNVTLQRRIGRAYQGVRRSLGPVHLQDSRSGGRSTLRGPMASPTWRVPSPY